ncbi:MAG: tetratricopeptide repeat protein, partial [Pyrinomonadaceae bacterium]|nr:tetratricopeptide repeat protein [Pyrinomonadaceae bacterium]
MIKWAKLLLMMFYAPARAMSEVRDRAPLAHAALFAWLAQSIYEFVTGPYLGSASVAKLPLALFAVLWNSAQSLLLIAIIFVPVMIVVSNLFDRRASAGLVVQQEYAATASAIFYAWAAANLAAIPIALFAKVTGLQAILIESSLQQPTQVWLQNVSEADRRQLLAEGFSNLIVLPFFALWTTVAVRELFNRSWARAVAIAATGMGAGVIVMFLVAILLAATFLGGLIASPFVLLLLFFLLRSYFGDVTSTHRARAAFKQNLEAATLNPADASAHYNLGLLHLKRNELDEARKRFERAIEIDPDEADAHYNLGRISRTQNSYPDAINHYEQVVTRDPTHAQHEIWREIGATYIAAGQYEDAREVLERFLEHRSSDPEGLYLMGRALAGLGHNLEAA